MKSKITLNQKCVIVAACILILVFISSIIVHNRIINQKFNTNSTKGESKNKQAMNETRYIHIYSVDTKLRDIIYKYAEEHWDFDYHINFVTNDIVFSSQNIIDISSDMLVNDPSSLDLYCVPAYAQYFIKGELSDYASTYEELGIEVEAALEAANIPQYIIDSGTNSEGKIIGLPYLANVSVFAYRRSVAKEVWGTDDPDEIARIIGGGTAKWDYFKQAAATLKEEGYYIVPGFKDLMYSIDKSFSFDEKGDINPLWEEFMDLSNYLYENECIKDTDTWSDQWFTDLDGVGDKIFGFITLSDMYSSFIQGNSVGDWAICLPPYITVDTTNILVNKNSPNKDIIGPLIEWLTLNSSETGLQFRLANGTFTLEQSRSVISGTVLKNTKNIRDYLSGQDENPVIYKALNTPSYPSFSSTETMDFAYWEDAVKAYLKGG